MFNNLLSGRIAEHCSRRERIAMEAERDVITMLKLEFMKDKVGEVYDGILNDDYYHYVEKLHLLRGEKKKSSYRIGDTVRVDRVDAVRKRIDFSLSAE